MIHPGINNEAYFLGWFQGVVIVGAREVVHLKNSEKGVSSEIGQVILHGGKKRFSASLTPIALHRATWFCLHPSKKLCARTSRFKFELESCNF